MWPFVDGYPTLRQVIVNLKDSSSFRGVLWQQRRGYVVLRNAELLKGRGEVVHMDGEIVVATDNVAFLQVLP